MKKVQVGESIAKLTAEQKATWIAKRKKARPDVDWDAGLKQAEADLKKAEADLKKKLSKETK